MSGSPRVLGDDEEYAAFVTDRWTRLVRAATLMGCDIHDAEDLVQTTLVKCYVSWSKVSKARDQDAYVYRVLVNTLRSARRRRSNDERPTGSSHDKAIGLDDFAQFETATSVNRALSELTVEARQVVVLRYLADLSERQTADVLNIPLGTVKSRLARALAQLATDRNLADLPGWRTP